MATSTEPAVRVDQRAVLPTRRSTAPLPAAQLLALSGYWFGIAALWAGLGAVLAGRLQFEHLVPPGTEGDSLFRILAIGGILALFVQPAAGAISDHTSSRWGRRTPFIVAGALADVVFLVGIATSSTLIAITGFVFALQMSSNVAQGPYQGLIPDRVPDRQVGLASGMVGMMIALGNVGGYLAGSVAIATHQYAPVTIALGLVQAALMGVLVVAVHDRDHASPRMGRSWWAIARSAFGQDLLHHRSFAWLVASRLLFLAGGSVLTTFAPFYIARSFALDEVATGVTLAILVGTIAVGTLASVVPAARLSDRVGRKRVIGAACAVGASSLLVVAVAPSLPVAVVGGVVFGLASGTFLAVDWALLSELIPADAAGRFMGIANVAAGSAGLLAAAVGGTVMDLVGGPGVEPSGPRAAIAVAAGSMAMAGVALRHVVEPVRDRR